MRRSFAALASLALFVALAAFPIVAAARGYGRGWTLLGERRVTDKLDHDTIAVTATRGDFHRLQLRVLERPVQFHKVVVHFGNGESQELELREVIRAGGRSRAIDLSGGDRVIRTIDLWYDAQSVAGKGALVRVFGQH
jgi:hypothetical protein